MNTLDLADLCTQILFHSNPISKEFLTSLKTAKIGWIQFAKQVFLFAFLIPVLLSFSILLLPLYNPLGPGNILQNSHWTFIFYVFVFCCPMSLLPHALAAAYLQKKDLYYSKFLLLSASLFIIVATSVMTLACVYVYPFPFSPILLIAPVWLGLNVAVFKTSYYLPAKYVKDPKSIIKANTCFMLSVMYLLGFCILLFYNFVCYSFRDNEVVQVILMLLYPVLSYLVRTAVLVLTYRIDTDCALQSLYVFDLWPSVYFQFQFASTHSSVFLNVLLLAVGTLEEMFSLIFLTRYWRKIPEKLKKSQRKAKLQGALTPPELSQQVLPYPSSLSFPKTNTTTIAITLPPSGQVLAPNVSTPAIVLNMAEKVHRRVKSCFEIGERAPKPPGKDNVQALSGREHLQRKKAKSFQGAYITPPPPPLPSTSMPSWFQHLPVRNQSKHPAAQLLQNPNPNIASTPTMTEKITPVVQTTNKNKLLSDYIPQISPTSGKMITIDDVTADNINSTVLFEKHRRRFKVIPFELECYNWRLCNTLSISLITAFISPCIYILLFTIVFWVPYNSSSYYISQNGDVSQNDIRFSFYFACCHLIILGFLLYMLTHMVHRRYGIDIRAGLYVLITYRKGFFLTVTTLVYGTSLFAQLIAMGIDVSFQFAWMKQKSMETPST